MGLNPNINPKNVNAACPHPERYEAESPQATEVEALDLLWGIVRAVQPDAVLETGTHKGAAAHRIAQALQQNRHGHLDTLEANQAHYEASRARLQGLPVTVHHAKSLEFTPARRYQVAFFDTTRKEELVTEFRYFRQWIDPGGIVAFHDTGSVWPTRATLEALEAEGLLSCVSVWTPRGITICEVKHG